MKENKNTKKETFLQLIKFGLVGVSNTVVDFAVLYLLSFLFNVFAGPLIVVFNVISFSAATVNSYFWNKKWTFEKKGTEVSKEFTKFLVVSVIGAGINTGVVYLITTLIGPQLGASPEIWVGVAKLAATAVALGWNFVGYKLWAFRESK